MANRLYRCILMLFVTFLISSVPERVTGLEQYCRASVLTEAGDVKIAAILALHDSEGGECVGISKNELQIAAAIRWAINMLNGNGDTEKSFVPGIRIGYDIYDDCGLEILSSKHLSDIHNVGESRQCTARSVNNSTTPLVGIIGTSISQTTASIARLLNHTDIPIVGIAATLSELSNKMMYPNFIRSVPSNKLQTRVILDMVKRLDWSYVIGIHTEDNYGREGFEAFRSLVQHTDICISRVLSVNRQDTNRRDTVADFIRSVLSEINSSAGDQIGIVYFGQDAEAIEIFDMVSILGSRWHNPQRFNNVQWIMSDGVETSSNVATAHKPFQSLLLSISPANNALLEIQEDFIRLLSMNSSLSLSVQWRNALREYVQSFYACGMTLSCSEEALRRGYRPYSYTSSALDAIYIFASTLKAAQSSLCPNSIGMCDQLRKALSENILKQYKPSTINYGSLGEMYVPNNFYANERYLEVDGNGDYVVRNESLYDINIAPYGKEEFSKVGDYTADGILNLSMLKTFWNLPTQSRCKSVCETCLHKDQLLKIYIPGDILVLGMFPVHGPGDTYSCGEYRSQDSSFVSLLSFLSTLSDFKRNTGVNVGGVVLDDCYNPLRAAYLLNRIFSGDESLMDTDSGQEIDLTKVIAVVGAQSSSLALSVLPALTNLKIPLISYSATSLDLDDRINYPYFLRTVPSDTTQAAAMCDILDRFNVNHVSVVNVNNNYGRKGVLAFRQIAESRGICVGKSIELTEKDSKADLFEAIYVLERSQTKYAVFFGLNTIAINLFDAMALSDADFIFIASETWGRNIKVIQGDRGKKSRGSLTLSVQTSAVVENRFEDFLSDLSTTDHNSNPWFGSFWQSTFQCNILKSFNNIYAQNCPLDLQLSEEQIKQFAGDQRAVQTMNAVYAVLKGYVDSVPDSCGTRFISECDRPEIASYVENIRSVTARTATGSRFDIFNSKGDGNIGFVVNNVQRLDDGSYTYIEVGSYDTKTLSLSTKNIKFYNEIENVISAPEASCKYIVTCTVCKEKEMTADPNKNNTDDNGGSMNFDQGSDDGALVPVVAVLGALVFVLIVFLGVVIFLVLRHNTGVKKETSNQEPHPSCYQVTTDTMRRPSQGTFSLSQGSTLNFSHVSPDTSDSTGTSTTSPGGTESDNPSANAQRLPVTYMSFERGSPEVISVISGTGQPQYTISRMPTNQVDYLHVVQDAVITPQPIQMVTRSSPSISNQTSPPLHYLHPIPENFERQDLPQQYIEHTSPKDSIPRIPAQIVNSQTPHNTVSERNVSGQLPKNTSTVEAPVEASCEDLQTDKQNLPLSMLDNSSSGPIGYASSENTTLYAPQDSMTVNRGITDETPAHTNPPHQYNSPNHGHRNKSPSYHQRQHQLLPKIPQAKDQAAEEISPQASHELNLHCENFGDGEPPSDMMYAQNPKTLSGVAAPSPQTLSGVASPRTRTQPGVATRSPQTRSGVASGSPLTLSGVASGSSRTLSGVASPSPQTHTGVASPRTQTLSGLVPSGPQTDTAVAALSPQNRPVYNRHNSYVTGEQLNPIPGPCYVHNTTDDENFV